MPAIAYLPVYLQASVKSVLSPKFYVDELELSSASVVLTVRAVMPGAKGIRLDLDRTRLSFSAVSLRRVCTSVSDLGKEIAVSIYRVLKTIACYLMFSQANYAADTIFRSPQLLGSLEMLGTI
jgi:hypothetical protein